MIVKRVRLLALLLAAVLLLSGCSLLTAERDGYVDMVPFDKMEYARPDLDAVLADAREPVVFCSFSAFSSKPQARHLLCPSGIYAPQDVQ